MGTYTLTQADAGRAVSRKGRKTFIVRRLHCGLVEPFLPAAVGDMSGHRAIFISFQHNY